MTAKSEVTSPLLTVEEYFHGAGEYPMGPSAFLDGDLGLLRQGLHDVPDAFLLGATAWRNSNPRRRLHLRDDASTSSTPPFLLNQP